MQEYHNAIYFLIEKGQNIFVPKFDLFPKKGIINICRHLPKLKKNLKWNICETVTRDKYFYKIYS